MKNTSLWIRTIVIIIVTLIGIYLVIGPRGSFTANDFSLTGIQNNVRENMNLGLDLRGGTHLVMRVDTDDYLRKLTENNYQAALRAAQEGNLPVTEGSYTAENGTYQFQLNLTDANQAQAVVDAVKSKVDIVNWTENTSGNTLSWSLPTQTQTILKNQSVDQALQIIESRINAYGVKRADFAETRRVEFGRNPASDARS